MQLQQGTQFGIFANQFLRGIHIDQKPRTFGQKGIALFLQKAVADEETAEFGRDVAIAAQDATFSLSEDNWGILPGALVSKVVADMVLPRHALYYGCLGEPFDGD